MTPEQFLNDRISLYEGDSRDVLKTIADDSIDACVCDPPYALVSIVKRFGGANAAPTKDGDVYARASAGFMGQTWDTGETAFSVEFWSDVLRVLKPGGYVIAASGTRTYHRLAVAIEDAGFEIVDMITWLYGSGFPKVKTRLKPACEPWVFARKNLIGTVAENIAEFGVGALNIDACRVHADDAQGGKYTVKRLKPGATLNATGGNWRDSDQAVEYHGETPPGRWPANVIHDGSDEVIEAFGLTAPSRIGKPRGAASGDGWGMTKTGAEYNDGGSAARFFYSAKADAMDRIGSKHPTVKPVDLMQYLCRLVTPPGGLVLDPFAGSGSTGEAAWREGLRAILIEREPKYCADIRKRLEMALAGPSRRRAAATRKPKAPLGLFNDDEGTEA